MTHNDMTRYDEMIGEKPGQSRTLAGSLPTTCHQASDKLSAASRLMLISLLLITMLTGGAARAWGQTKVSDGIYYIRNNGTNEGYLWPSLTTNTTTGYRYLTTSLATSAEAVDNVSGVSYPAHDKSYSHWVVKNVTGGYIQLINPRLDKYVVIRTFPKANNTKENEYGDRDVWLTDKPAEEQYTYFELNNPKSPYKISPKAGLNGVENTSGYSLNSAAGNDRKWLTWSTSGDPGTPKNGEGRDGLIQCYSVGTPLWSFTSDLLDAPNISVVDESTNTFTIADTNGLVEGYTIRYTTGDGTQDPPTANTGTEYTGPVEVMDNWTVKAVVVRYGIVLTKVATGSVSPVVPSPIISFDNSTNKVSIHCATSIADIYYNTGDGTQAAPTTTTGTRYTDPFDVTSPTTIKAISSLGEEVSSVTTLIIEQVAEPTIQSYGSNAISITTETPGATIYYTTDGSTPSTSSTVYSSPLSDNVSNVTIKAIAVKEGMITSAVGSGSVKLQCATPIITRVGLTFTLSCSKPTDATLYYTLGGGSETLYNGPVAFTKDQLPMTVTAVARHSDYTDSETASLELKTGSGTPLDPYLIYGSTDFTNFVNNVNNGTTASACYKLGSDVSASGVAAITTEFSGTFDGGGYTITGLTNPLFDIVNGGTVKNVTLKGVNISCEADTVGAIASIAKGYSRIYNCGILPNGADFPDGIHPSITTSGKCAGGLVGSLRGDSRVINCYSYADVQASNTASGIVGKNEFASNTTATGNKYVNLRTAIVNCMFYGDILGGTNQYGVYGGQLITNAAANGISSYNYFRNGSKFTAANGHKNTSSGSNVVGNPTAYNCSFPADESHLTQVEFHRSLLNSNRELCGWWVKSDVAPRTLATTQVQAIEKDASIIYKWVVDRSLAPYPILKPFGKYTSVINSNGNQLGTLTVTVQSGSHSTASDKTVYLPITDMDTLNHDYSYYKVQLPYYNTVFGKPNEAAWRDRYAGNYTDYVVTGWIVTNVNKEGKNEFLADWQYGYNFADRDCTEKDLNSKSNRVFAQGGYYYVPNGVTAITIQAYWGKAFYVCDDGNSYDRVNITAGTTGSHFAPAGIRTNNVNGATIYTTKIRDVIDNIDAKKTVYDYAIVLVGNVQESNGDNPVTVDDDNTRGFTIMSADFDFDEEPDYCLEWQLGTGTKRNAIAPIRFDFLPVVELGIAGKRHDSTNFFSLGCFRSYGHFEVTETAFIHFGQFEFEQQTRDDGPIILNGGIFDQYTRGTQGNDASNDNNHITYVIVGGHVVMPSFTPGAHPNASAKYKTRHCAVNVLGGNFNSFYLTGGYNESIKPYEDNPHCYIDGGHFGTIAAAYKEGIAGDVTWRINHALIDEFYGGGIMSQDDGDYYKIVKGNIDVVINNSTVGKYCGGPKFGNMVSGKKIKTSATGTTFREFYGAGNGGTNYVQFANDDKTDGPRTPANWLTLLTSSGNGKYSPKKYISIEKGYHANFDYEEINPSTGTTISGSIDRIYYYSAQFATTNTGDVTSTLTGCTVEKNFYGAGFLGGVNGNVISTLTDCTVNGSVFGAGYSASAGTVKIYNTDRTAPSANVYTGLIKPQSGGSSTTYIWTDKASVGENTLSTNNPAATVGGKNYFFTEVPLVNLGAVDGNVTLTLDGNTTVNCNVFKEDGTIDNTKKGGVYGGGDASSVKGAEHTVTVNLNGNVTVNGNVFGGGNEGLVEGNTTVNIGETPAP